MFKLLTLLAFIWSAPALAQNPTCPTRPIGDSSNACASTAFVKTSFPTFACPASQWVRGGTAGAPICSQPAFTDISGDLDLATQVTGTLAVGNGGTGLTAGTSGGIPYFSATNTLASSAALTANLPVIGGGAGVAPSVGTRSGNTTQFVTTTGAQTSGNCVEIDADGNHIASSGACGGGGGGRIRLSANTTLYVDALGSDSNPCTAPGVDACLTPQHAVDIATDNYDLNGYNLTIVSTNRNYNTTLAFRGGQVGRGIISFNGGGSTIQVTSGDAIHNSGSSANYIAISNVTLSTITSGYCIIWQVPGYLFIGSGVKLNYCATGGIFSAATGSVVQLGTSIEFVGAIPIVLAATSGGALYATDAPSVGTLTGTPIYSYFAFATGPSTLQMLNWTFSGAGSGQRFFASLNGVIETGGGGANYFPGSVAGGTTTGGQYN